jgi:hypothetical protein
VVSTAVPLAAILIIGVEAGAATVRSRAHIHVVEVTRRKRDRVHGTIATPTRRRMGLSRAKGLQIRRSGSRYGSRCARGRVLGGNDRDMIETTGGGPEEWVSIPLKGATMNNTHILGYGGKLIQMGHDMMSLCG